MPEGRAYRKELQTEGLQGRSRDRVNMASKSLTEGEKIVKQLRKEWPHERFWQHDIAFDIAKRIDKAVAKTRKDAAPFARHVAVCENHDGSKFQELAEAFLEKE
jgi:hypothetical protein